MSFIVAVTDSVFPSLEPEQRVLAPLAVELRPGQCRSEEEVIELTRGVDAVLNCYAKITARVIETLDRCKIIARYGIGVDNVDLAAAKRLPHRLVNLRLELRLVVERADAHREESVVEGAHRRRRPPTGGRRLPRPESGHAPNHFPLLGRGPRHSQRPPPGPP